MVDPSMMYGGEFREYQQILEQLKIPDEMLQYEAVMNLRNQLSIADENSLRNFAVDQFLQALVEILKKPPESDLSNEVNMFTIQCLTILMDIFPNICNHIINQGGVKCFVQILERSMGFIDLNEACIKAFEKISIENPHAILIAGAMGLVLNMMDFFEITTQKRIIQILLNISRQCATEAELNDHILPLMPCLCMLLQQRGGGGGEATCESISSIILRILESTFRFFSPHSQQDKLTATFNKIGNTGILDSILHALQDYCAYESSMRESLKGTSSSQQSSQKLLTNATVQNFLKALSISSSMSMELTRTIMDSNIFKLIETFLPSSDDQKKSTFSVDHYPFIIESLSLIDSLLPQREDEPTEDTLSTISEAQKAKAKLLNDKRQLYTTAQFQSYIAFAAEKLLPKIFNVHENNIQSNMRALTLQTIDKLILLFNDELLNNFIEPYSFAKFIFANLRSNQLQSLQQCLQMVDKLMKSNPKTYTLPLIREGVAQQLKKFTTIEQLEKLTGLTLIETVPVASGDKASSVVSATLEKTEEALIQAKNILMRGPGIVEGQESPEQRLVFEKTMQKYLELARQAPEKAGTAQSKLQTQLGKSVVGLASSLISQYFENQEFLSRINEMCGDELMIIQSLKQLAADIVEEGKKQEFDFKRNRDLMKALAQLLTNSRQLMTYELKESGLLDSLQLYLTMTPKQIELYCEQQKADSSKEEVKRSEEMQLSTLTKNSKNITKKQAKCFIQRLKVFLHLVLNKVNNKQPLVDLVNLCQELVSQSDYLIFQNTAAAQPAPTGYETYGQWRDGLANPISGLYSHQIQDPNHSLAALRQLTRRMKVNLIYDPSLNKATSPQKGREAAMSGVTQDIMMQLTDQLLPPPTIQKSSSHHPAFIHLADQQVSSPTAQKQSKVFMKRNFLFNELKQVLVSVEQCASLLLLEDFLRNRIKTIEDVKALKVPPSYYGSGGGKAQTSASKAPVQARLILDRAIDRMRDLIESSGTREQMKQDYEEFTLSIVEEILITKELADLDQLDLIRQIEAHTHVVLDDFYADHGSELELRGDNYDQFITEDGEDQNPDQEVETEERLYEFQKAMMKLREIYKKKKVEMIKSGLVKKESPKQIIDTTMATTTTTTTAAAIIEAPSSEEKQQPDALMKDLTESQHDLDEEEEEKKEQSSIQATDQAKMEVLLKGEDVDMTDEEEEERRQIEAIMARKRAARGESSDGIAVMIGQEERQTKDIANEDLEQLIKATGDDIEFEFYIGGELVTPSQTIYEVLKATELKAKKYKDSGLPSAGIRTFLDQLHRDGDLLTVTFCIKEKQESLSKTRKDSILEFSQKRERTKSEVVEDISVSSVDQFVQQLLEKEFQVFNKDQEVLKTDKNYKEKQQLENSLKILKVLNYLCRNINLFSSQGIKFLVNNQSYSQLDEEIKEEGFQDLDLQVGISQIHANLFHHHKLDAYILKNIQDPFNLMSGAVSDMLNQIFKNCPFLFPFQTRLLFFKLISFIGSIDMNRSIYFLRQFLKQKLGKLPAEDKNSAKLQRQKVIVDRNQIIECSLNLMNRVSNRAFLEVEYKDEIGTGLGPTLEFYYLVAQAIKDFKQPTTQISIWRQGMADNSLFPAPINLVNISNEELQKIYDVYRLAGMMIAKSISDDRLIDLPISPLFWDLVLGKKINIFDLERLDPNIFKVFADLQLLANKKRDIDKLVGLEPEQRMRMVNSIKTSSDARVEDLSLAFTLPGHDHIELKPNGKNEDVTIENLQEYLDLAMHYFFQDTIKIQIQAFKKGFNQIFPVENLRPFSNSSIELEDMICGTQRNEDEWTSLQKLQEFIVPAHGYHQKSAQYLNFLRLITELDKDERRKFLRFVTGSPRLPQGGFGALDPKLTVVLKKPTVMPSMSQQMKQEIINSSTHIDEILPSVMTCQNYVKLPAYSSYEMLKLKFQQAYNEGCNNFTLS